MARYVCAGKLFGNISGCPGAAAPLVFQQPSAHSHPFSIRIIAKLRPPRKRRTSAISPERISAPAVLIAQKE
jgi:hypothetical protein